MDGHAGEEKAPCVPGIWIKEASAAGGVRRWVCPQGKIADLLRSASEIVEDVAALERCRDANPDLAPPAPLN